MKHSVETNSWRLTGHERCEDLPFRTPGAIQDHGWLLAFERASGRLSHVSANLIDPAGDRLDAARSGETDVGAVLNALGLPLGIKLLHRFEEVGIRVPWLGEGLFAINSHSSSTHLVVEIEPDTPPKFSGVADAIGVVLESESYQRFAERMVALLGPTLGYDRTMAYHLHADGHGEVIAEHLGDLSAEPYLGLHYPATDIPEAARQLYVMQLVRVIPDVEGSTVQLIAPSGDQQGADHIDLGLSPLRAVAPVHLEYLRNMGVRSTAAISVVRADRLVGMFVMHHHTPRPLGHRDRDTLTGLSRLASFVSLSMGERVSGQRNSKTNELAASLRHQLGANLEVSTATTLERRVDELTAAVDADGLLIRLGNEVVRHGVTPEVDQVDLIVSWLAPGELAVATSDLHAYSPAIQGAEDCGGLILRRWPGEENSYIAWFRRPQVTEVAWGGDPRHVAYEDEAGALHPRTSFDTFLEKIADRCRIWDDNDLSASLSIYDSAQAGLLERAYRDLADQALTDSLTGLGNRVALGRALGQAKSARTDPQRPVSLLFLDLDRFKVINDAFGHEQGDRVLIASAQRLVEVVRAVSGPLGRVFRLGGDEFVVLLAGVEQQVTTTAADAIVEAFRLPLQLGDVERQISTSVGIVVDIDSDLPSVELLRRGDLAMYAAKGSGGSQTAFFDENHSRLAIEQSLLEQQLHTALREREFRVAYQQLISLESHHAVGAEALVRWRRPSGELVSPMAFIDLAEHTGQIVELDRLVVTDAVGECLTLLRDESIEFHLAVNASARSLNAEYVELIAELVATHSFDPGRLMIEVTESAMAQDSGNLVTTLNQIRALSVKVAIDDFGTGYSSLAYLHDLPADVVKLDRTFVSRLSEQAGDQVVARWFIQLIEELNMRVIAEGVETKLQEEILVGIGYDWVQGYRYGMPVLAPPRVGPI